MTKINIKKEAFIKPITITINQMIHMRIFPGKLKIAKIIPIFKKMMKLNLPILEKYLFYLQYLKYLKELYSSSYFFHDKLLYNCQ